MESLGVLEILFAIVSVLAGFGLRKLDSSIERLNMTMKKIELAMVGKPDYDTVKEMAEKAAEDAVMKHLLEKHNGTE
jgi:hypothetical protein